MSTIGVAVKCAEYVMQLQSKRMQERGYMRLKKNILTAGLLLLAFFLSACGAGRRQKGERTDVSVDNFVADMDTELILEVMQSDEEACKTSECKYLFSYENDIHNISISYCLGAVGSIDIDGSETKLNASLALSGGYAPEIGFFDINNDGTEDIILRWEQFRSIQTAVFLSEEGDFKELASVNDLNVRFREYEAEYLDNYKIRVKCSLFDVDAVFDMRSEAASFIKAAGWLYDEAGRLKEGERTDGLYAVADAAIDFFIKDNKLYICHRFDFNMVL